MKEPSFPDKQSKREAILTAAQTVFLRSGFDVASMQAIAREAEVSKQTVYNHYGSKEELFRAVVQTGCTAIYTALHMNFLRNDDEPERVLTAFGVNVLDVMLSPEAMRMRRLLQNEGQRHPELAELFYNQGPDRTANSLATYLTDQTKQGRLNVREPRLAAEQFVAMLPGHIRLRHFMGFAPPTRVERRKYVANAVQIFLSGARRAD